MFFFLNYKIHKKYYILCSYDMYTFVFVWGTIMYCLIGTFTDLYILIIHWILNRNSCSVYCGGH